MASLDSIGKPGSVLNSRQLQECEQILHTFSNKLVQDSKKKLRAKDKGNGVLDQSITATIHPTVYVLGKPLELTISMADYWKYVDGEGNQYGRKPNSKAPPTEAIEDWIQVNADVQGSFGRKLPRKTLAFLIARSIGKKGIKAVPFWTSTINDGRLKQLGVDMSVCFAKDVSIVLKDTFKSNN